MQQSPLPGHSWRQALEAGTDVEATLEALASYGLASHTQHMELLQCPGMVKAILQHLPAAATLPLTSPPGMHVETVEAALEALVSLTTSQQGVQALIDAGAVGAACRLLQGLPVVTACHTPPAKRHKPDAGACSGLHQQPTEDEEALLDIVALLLQLLAALLLQTFPARPVVGSLDPSLAADTAAALLKVSWCCWQDMPLGQQQSAAAVLMRLAMEPGVAALLCQHSETVAAAAAGGECVGERPSQQAPRRAAAQRPPGSSNGASCSGSSSSSSSAPGSPGLSLLLGPPVSEDQFLKAHWELAPLLCRPAQGSACSNEAQLLAQVLTPSGVLGQLLPSAVHCPVLPACIDDPVQALHNLHTQGHLLQPLQPTDVRVVKTLASTPDPTASQSPHPVDAGASSHQHPAITAPVSHRHDSTPHNGSPPGSSADALPADAASGSRQQELLADLQGSVSAAALLTALQSGFTVVLRDVPKRCCVVGQLAEALEAQLGLPAGANLYLTPAGAQGLQAHYDDHDVFVLQLAGSKAWLVGPPQHHPLPLTHQLRLPVLPPDQHRTQHQQLAAMGSAEPHLPVSDCVHQQQQSQEQVEQQSQGQQSQGQGQGQPADHGACWPQRLVLQAGDCLYLPRGWVHQAVSVTKPAPSSSDELPSSLHVSVGVEVSAEACVQGFLHHLVEACASRQLAGTCSCCCSCPSPLWTASAAPGELQQGSAQQRARALASRAAALLLHLRLWRDGRQHPVYRKACPLLASGATADLLSAAVLSQLQQAHHSAPRSCCTTPLPAPEPQPQQGCLLSQPAGPAAPNSSPQALHAGAQPPRLLHHAWLDLAVQQLSTAFGPLSSSCQAGASVLAVQPQPQAGHCAGGEGLGAQAAEGPAGVADRHTHPLALPDAPHASAAAQSACKSDCCTATPELRQLLQHLSAHPLGDSLAAGASVLGPMSAGSGVADGGSGGDLLDLCSHLQAATGSMCGCGSSSCHSSLMCAAAVLLQAQLPEPAERSGDGRGEDGWSLPQHVCSCACCASLLLGAGADLQPVSSAGPSDAPVPHRASSSTVAAAAAAQLQSATLETPAALAALRRGLGCPHCRSEAAAAYVARARAELASCQALRRGFLALAALSQGLVLSGGGV